MLAESVVDIEQRLPADALVLDVGAWGRPFGRADWVIDRMPYATRGLYGRDGTGPERYSADTWVEFDITSREPWPFPDDRFDFAICSHVLEDVRDPLWVAAELSRVAKAGYVEVPSRREEQTFGIQGPWVGWGHHHWICDVDDTSITFAFKHHVVHGQPAAQFPAGSLDGVSRAERVQRLWWTGTLEAREREFAEPADLDEYLAAYVREHPVAPARRRRRFARSR